MIEKNWLPCPYTKTPAAGTVHWKAPSNIALVKYWGKNAYQIPANPSISFTLDNCNTITSVDFRKKEHTAPEFDFDFLFEGRPKTTFKPKIQTFFERIVPYMPFLREYHLSIATENSFPHSSGIASSASGMAALALCLVDIEQQMIPEMNPNFFIQKASFLARLGSGSACRSIQGNIVQWGMHDNIPGSSNLYGIPYPQDIHPVFQQYQDTILLVHKEPKHVSSTLGHKLMHGHPFAESRFIQAHDHLNQLQSIFATGDLEAFITIVEREALTLHALMMTSLPYFILMQPPTVEIIQKIWNYRKTSQNPVCFTLDAGANVHLLYPNTVKDEVLQFIQDELIVHCENEHYICDHIGTGAKKINHK